MYTHSPTQVSTRPWSFWQPSCPTSAFCSSPPPTPPSPPLSGPSALSSIHSRYREFKREREWEWEGENFHNIMTHMYMCTCTKPYTYQCFIQRVGCPGISHPKAQVSPLKIFSHCYTLYYFPTPNGISSPT